MDLLSVASDAQAADREAGGIVDNRRGGSPAAGVGIQIAADRDASRSTVGSCHRPRVGSGLDNQILLRLHAGAALDLRNDVSIRPGTRIGIGKSECSTSGRIRGRVRTEVGVNVVM